MSKTIHRDEYTILVDLIQKMRLRAGLKQSELSSALGRPQSFISNLERKLVRLDVLQLMDICKACGRSFSGFCRDLEKSLE